MIMENGKVKMLEEIVDADDNMEELAEICWRDRNEPNGSDSDLTDDRRWNDQLEKCEREKWTKALGLLVCRNIRLL